MKQKRLVTAVLLIASLYGAPSMAISDTAPGQSVSIKQQAFQAKMDAKSVLIKKLERVRYFSANFSQVVVDADGVELQRGNGSLVVRKPNLVRWKTMTPNETLIVSDGKTLWFYDPFVDQATAYGLQSSIANTPILLLTSQDPSMWLKYDVSYIAKNSFVIRAKDSANQVKTLQLTFAGHQLASIVILDATGQSSQITLSDLDVKSLPNMDLFKFVLPPGVDLEDQR